MNASETKTCQICGRQIKAKNGLIAHHGFRRPGDGWQTASCEGARHRPFEVTDTLLKTHIEDFIDAVANAKKFAATKIEMVVFKKRSYSNYITTYTPFEVTEENFNELKAQGVFRSQSFYNWNELVKREQYHRDTNVTRLESYLKHQQERYDTNPFRPY